MIKVEKCIEQGNGGYNLVPCWINKSEISTITKTDYYRYAGTYYIRMNNGEKFYAYLNEDDI